MKRSGLPKYVTWVHVNGKRYARGRKHGKGHYFKHLPGTEEFAVEYQRWLAGHDSQREGIRGTKPGSVSALIAKFYRSAEWANLSAATQATYRGILERFRNDHGDKPVNLLERHHVKDLMARKANTPSAANNMVRMIRILMRFAIDEGWRKDDPTLGIKMLKIKSDGFHCWTDEELETFERHWPIGTRERLAFALLLYSFQRRGDVIRLGASACGPRLPHHRPAQDEGEAHHPGASRLAADHRRHAIGQPDLLVHLSRTTLHGCRFRQLVQGRLHGGGTSEALRGSWTPQGSLQARSGGRMDGAPDSIMVRA